MLWIYANVSCTDLHIIRVYCLPEEVNLGSYKHYVQLSCQVGASCFLCSTFHPVG